MRANIIACLLAVGFFTCLTVLDLRSRVPSRVNLIRENEPPVEDEGQADGPDAYKMAVLLSVGVAILSLFA
jgi:hypothetical protein